MKKLIIISTFLISMFSFSLPVGELNVKGGFLVGYLLNEKRLSQGGFVEAEYLYPVYTKDKFGINTGAGLTFSGFNYRDNLEQASFQLDIYATPKVKYEITDEISIYGGVRTGVGYRGETKINNHYVNVPVGLNLGVQYDNVNLDLTFGNDFLFGVKKSNNTITNTTSTVTSTTTETTKTNDSNISYNLNGKISVGYFF